MVRKYLRRNTVENDQEDGLRYSVAFLNNLTAGAAYPNRKLKLSKGVIAISLCSTDLFEGHVRRSSYTLAKMALGTLQLTFATGPKTGSRLCLPLILRSPSGDSFPVQNFLKIQLPISVCFKITTNQGPVKPFSDALQTDFCESVFSRKQVYIVIRRTAHSKFLSILFPTCFFD